MAIDHSSAAKKPDLPLGKVLDLSALGDELLKSIFYVERVATLQKTVVGARKLLEAEACGIFLISDHDPDLLTLEADFSEKFGHQFEPVEVRVESRMGGGLTGHVATLGQITNFSGAELATSPFTRGEPARHLLSSQCYSFLSIPLKDRKGRLLGVLNAHNKKDQSGVPQPGLRFDAADEAMARILATKIVLILESQRIFSVFRDVTHAIYNARTLDDVLNEILLKA
jgi:hypothetical protein